MLFEGLVYQGKQKWRRRGPSRQSKGVIHARVESATQCGGPPLSLYNYLHSFSLSYHPNLSVGERERDVRKERDFVFVMEETGGLVPKPSVKKGLWKPEEDLLLKKYVEAHGEGKWATVSERSGDEASSNMYTPFSLSVNVNACMGKLLNIYSVPYRIEEGWEELQAEMEELSETQHKTWRDFQRGRRSNYPDA